MMNMDVTTTTTTTRRPKRLSCHDDDNNNKISVVGHRRRCHGHRRPIMATATTLLFSMMMMTTTTTTTTILLLLSHLMVVTAFTPLPLPPPLLRRTCSWRRRHSSSSSSSSSTTTSSNTWPLHGIAEWRDKTFDFPGNDRSSSRPLGGKPSDETQALPMLLKEICILPFPFFEVLLQGETKQLRLYEERFLQLFEYCMEHHHGVVAMGLLASGDDNNTGIIQTVPLCEMEAYHRMERFGIFVTIRVVGRAQLHEIMQQQQQQSPPYIKAVCRELHDQIPPNLELPNLLAGTIENYLMLLSKMEAQLVQAAPPPPKANVTNETDTTDDDDDEDEDDSAMAREMKRRIEVAKLDDRFYDDDLDNDDDEDDDKLLNLDRQGRFQKAYQVALRTDTQGYCVAPGSTTMARSPQELTALSWAAFCTSNLPEEEDAAMRIQALDCDNLFERLKLASHMLKEKKNRLQTAMEKAGIPFRQEEEEGEEEL